MASETTLCGNCGHDHQSKYPPNYPYPDKVCPLAPGECDCFSFNRDPVRPTIPPKRWMCRRCGYIDKPNSLGSHQAECLSDWVEAPPPAAGGE